MEIAIVIFICAWMTTSVVLAYRKLKADFAEVPEAAPAEAPAEGEEVRL